MPGKSHWIQIALSVVSIGLVGTVLLFQLSTIERANAASHAANQRVSEVVSLNERTTSLVDILADLSSESFKYYVEESEVAHLAIEITRLREQIADIPFPDYGAEIMELNQRVKTLTQMGPASSPATEPAKDLPTWNWLTSLDDGYSELHQCVLRNSAKSPDVDDSWVLDYLNTVRTTIYNGAARDEDSAYFFMVNLGAAHNCWLIRTQ